MSEETLEYPLLTRALRGLLRQRGLRYRQVAEALGVAESTIKRVLTAKDGSVGRLARIAEFAGVRFADLVAAAHEGDEPRWFLDETQEAYFLENPEVFQVFIELHLHKRTPEEVRAWAGLSARAFRGYLERLESLGLIEVTGRRELRVLPRGALSFRKGSAFYRQLIRQGARQVVARLTGPEEPGPEERLWNREWMAAPASLARLRAALHAALEEMELSATRDEALLPREDLVPVAGVVGLAVGPAPAPRLPDRAPPALEPRR